MNERTRERVSEWDSRPFTDGYEGLHALADENFSGAVVVGDTHLFMLNGRVVGVHEGTIEAFEDATGTVYSAPHKSLPLLFSMLEADGETQATYYTNDTPLSETDAMLSDASFTGYVELSENVLSGDYYTVYYGGRSMSAAFVGTSDDLVTGDEAFERADGEVGLYEVVKVDVDIVDIPEVETESEPENAAASTAESAGTAAGASAAGGAASEAASEAATESATEADGESDAEPGRARGPTEPRAEPTDEPATAAEPTATGEDEATEPASTADAAAEPATDAEPETEVEAEPDTDVERGVEPTDEPATDAERGADENAEEESVGVASAEAASDRSRSAADAGETSGSKASAADEESVSRDGAASGGVSIENAESDAAADDSGATAGEESAASASLETESVLDESVDALARDEGEDEAEAEPRPGPAEPGREPVSEGPTARAIDDAESDGEPAGTEPESGASAEPSGRRSRAKPGETASQGVDERFQEEAQWRSTKSVPAINPEQSKSGAGTETKRSRAAAEKQRREQKRTQRSAASDADSGGESESSSRQSDGQAQRDGQSGGRTQRDILERARERIGTLERAVEERDERIATLEAELSAAGDAERIAELERQLAAAEERAAEAEADAGGEELDAVRAELREAREELSDVRDDLESVREERDRLRERVEDLEEQLAEVGGVAGGEALDPEAAVSGTNLFVRYGSKADATLDAVGETDPDEINANLTLEHHTQFEAADATVNGEPFAAFLESTPEYRFVSWVVRELPYEILDTGHRKGLAGVFDVVSDIDRAELHGTVETENDEGAEHVTEFDVVIRDRMGNPLLVANLNTSREPVRGGEMEALVDDAGTVATDANLGGAFYVTSSFFEPDALEAASEATDAGGLLSRSDKESYVKVSRKNGFHLCLVEDRNGTFHLTVPEL
ncbi:DUF7527 domain-containing protein [Halocalculus aciditolerans]|uniref:DUF7527 domain-containing protein n=1 Tax=Halocalculus aciditolerans TaxID=1383812 RepID=A0A830FL16_9EURY|nr:transcriptional regulator [Halocalculus aciditolerans]GGL56856.1 hypothetical protein GCM10009039_13730 [Halocalculus aciditolerans]